jgi:hypothetical protein
VEIKDEGTWISATASSDFFGAIDTMSDSQ